MGLHLGGDAEVPEYFKQGSDTVTFQGSVCKFTQAALQRVVGNGWQDQVAGAWPRHMMGLVLFGLNGILSRYYACSQREGSAPAVSHTPASHVCYLPGACRHLSL